MFSIENNLKDKAVIGTGGEWTGELGGILYVLPSATFPPGFPKVSVLRLSSTQADL